MRIGVDIDGVVADFVKGFRDLVLARTGKDIGCVAGCWDWWQDTISKEEFRAAWGWIVDHPEWWLTLPVTEDGYTNFGTIHRWSNAGVEIYMISTRPGKRIRQLTQLWVNGKYGGEAPVLIARDEAMKGRLASALELTHFVDDKPSNCEAVLAASPGTHVRLLDRPWNQESRLLRISNLEELVQHGKSDALRIA